VQGSKPGWWRPKITKQIRELIFQMVAENPTWGAPHLHGELLMLGFDVSETTVSRWMKRAPRHPEPGRRWLAFLHNHREAIAAMDFFTVPTLTFNVLYCFFIINHDRRDIVHFNVTRHPTSRWIVQQLREAFPYDAVPNFLLLDHDAKCGFEVPSSYSRVEDNPGCEPRLDAPGRTAWLSAGSVVAAANCSTT
jgi:putative transposase